MGKKEFMGDDGEASSRKKNAGTARLRRPTNFVGGTGAAPRATLDYQLALVTPGMSPAQASSRKVRREIWNSRMKARLRPEMRQRLDRRTGLALRGNCDNAR